MNRNIFVMVFLCTFFLLSGKAQNAEMVAKLRKELMQVKGDTAKARILGTLCYEYLYSNKEEAKKYCDDLLLLVERLPVSKVKGLAYWDIANYYLEIDNFTASENYFGKGLDIASKLSARESNELKAKLLLANGLIYHKMGDFEIAARKYFEVLSLIEQYGTRKMLIDCYTKLADVHGQLNDKEKRDVYRKKLMDMETSVLSDEERIRVYNIRGLHYIEEGKEDSAKYCFQKMFALARESNDTYYTAMYYQRMAELAPAIVEKEKFYKLAYDCTFAVKDYYVMCVTLSNWASMLVENRKYDKVEELVRKGLYYADSLKYTALLPHYYVTLYNVYFFTGNYKKACEITELLFESYQNSFSEEKQKQISFFNVKYEAAQREAQIQKLEDENKMKELAIKARLRLIIALAGLVVLLVVIFVILYRYRQNMAKKDKKIREQKIRELEQEKQIEATQAVLQGETKERSRLARDLHDGLGGMLSVVKLNLANVKGDAIVQEKYIESFQNAINMLDNSIKELRRVAHSLMPAALLRYGLKTALSDLVNHVGIASFHFYGVDRRLDDNLEIVIYRIVYELVNNAIKHSEASQVDIQLIIEDDRISINVHDNGKGFNVDEVTEGTGLENIRSRVGSFHGNINITSSAGNGTEVAIDFSLL